jgi:general nucleoside transport system ATP-binding protein
LIEGATIVEPPRNPVAIELVDVTKRFGPVVANQDITFDARYGEVHALIGENGAGKSTLMSIVAGLYRPDSGRLRINGQQVHFKSPRDAIERGIGMVYQHFMLVETMTVAENLLIGMPQQGIGLKTDAAAAAVRDLSARFGLDVDPDAYIWQLSVGEQQRVEIIRLLFRGAKILVLDEPTAVLTPAEAAGLIKTVRAMVAEGYCIIFISHKLDEVLRVADRITVLRRGQTVGTVTPADVNRRSLARMMVGREMAAPPVDRPAPGTEIALFVRNLCVVSDRGLHAVNDLSLEVRNGEILGIAGVAGNGQREFAEAVTGLRPAISGEIEVSGRDQTGSSAATLAAAGVAHIPEDRLATGLAGGIDVETNATLRQYRHAPLSKGPVLMRKAMGAFADRLIAEHDVKTPSRRARVRQLSGGNQQKLIIARELAGSPAVIIASYPTRGVDIGATEAIHQLLRSHRDRGAAIVLISEDLDELRSLSDRIGVLVRGKIIDTIPVEQASNERLSMLMAGIGPDYVAASLPGAPVESIAVDD